MNKKSTTDLEVMEALKLHAREEAERLRRTLHSSAIAHENNPHLTYLRQMPDALPRLLARYAPYFSGNYMCPQCHIWQRKMEVLRVDVNLSGDVYACADCAYMLVWKPSDGAPSLSNDP
jgi:hypothetical protein